MESDSRWTDKQSRVEARQAWMRQPKSARRQAVRLARRGRSHPDQAVRAAAADLSNGWFFEFTAVRVVLTAAPLLISVAALTALLGLPPAPAFGLVVLVIILFAGTGITASNVRHASVAPASGLDQRSEDFAADTLASRLRTLGSPMSLLGLALLAAGIFGPRRLSEYLWIAGFACLFLGVGVMPLKGVSGASGLADRG
jgi:hypothetical protein